MSDYNDVFIDGIFSFRLYCKTMNATVASPMSPHEQYALYDFVQNNGQKLWIGVHSVSHVTDANLDSTMA